MGVRAYYNEIDPYAAEWLRNLIKAGHIIDGEVDTRSIVDVSPDDIKHFDQCHFFAGIAGWSHALRLAGWADDRKIWTGSCPCQPFSVAGKGKGTDDERHLWPHFFRLIRSCRPPVIMGEQVAGAAGYGWLDGVRFDLESEGYTIDGVDIPACSVNAPHIRQRLYWVAANMGDTVHKALAFRQIAENERGDIWEEGKAIATPSIGDPDMANSDKQRTQISFERGYAAIKEPGSTGDTFSDMVNADTMRELQSQGSISNERGWTGDTSFWNNAIWLNGADGKARRAEPSIRLLANGVPARVGKLRAYGNAIVPQVAAEVIKAFMNV
jgi:DNA (cytosine-5)-methyltransferase 1